MCPPHRRSPISRTTTGARPYSPFLLVGDGEHRCVGDLSEDHGGQVSPEGSCVLAMLHEIGEGSVDRAQQGVDLVALFATTQRQ